MLSARTALPIISDASHFRRVYPASTQSAGRLFFTTKYYSHKNPEIALMLNEVLSPTERPPTLAPLVDKRSPIKYPDRNWRGYKKRFAPAGSALQGSKFHSASPGIHT